VICYAQFSTWFITDTAQRQKQTGSEQSMSENRCPECGAPVVGGRAGCQALWDEMSAQVYHSMDNAAARDLAFDAYCMQHPERYCRSAKSHAAHLTRLCCGLEYGGDPQVYAAIQQWLNGTVDIKKPEAPGRRGALTVSDLSAARSGQEHARLVHEWAASVWEAYTAQHKLARNWIQAALRAQEMTRTRRPARP
jgi:hypothetical protein